MSLATLLDKTGAFQRSASTKDAVGGSTKVFTTISGLSAVPCSVAPASWKTTKELEREDMVVESEIYTSVDVSAKIGDRWLIDGIYYNVLAYKPFDNAKFGAPVYVTVAGKRNQ